MPVFQRSTTYDDSTNVFRGSAKVSASPYQSVPSYTSAGAQTALTVTRNLDTTEETVDDAQGVQTIFNDEFTITFDRYEVLDKDFYNIIMGSTDTVTNVAGSLVSGATDVWASSGWTYDVWVALEGQNGAGTAPTINSVTGSVDGALVLNTDYSLTKSGSKWGIVVTDSVTVTTTAQTITINYDYTPSAGYTVQGGNSSTLSKFILKLEGSNDNGKSGQWDFWLCQIVSLGDAAFQADDAEDRRLAQPLEIIARPDSLYHSDGADGGYSYKFTQA
jgi:hypothetical protein